MTPFFRCLIWFAPAMAVGCGWLSAAPTLFRFDLPADRLAPSSGPGLLEWHDPEGTGWGPTETGFGKASEFGLPAPAGGNADVMAFPACAASQGYLFTHGADPNGAYTDWELVSNYTFIYDIYYPAASDGKWRGLLQTNPANSDDGEIFIQNSPSGGTGINSNYRGNVIPGQWHRIAISMRAAQGEGQMQRYIDGQFAGAIGTTGSSLEDRFALQSSALLLTDNDGETAPGFLASLFFTDRAMTGAEIKALGGVHADGANVPGPPAPEYPVKMVRRVDAIGHRGGSYGAFPDNTLPALNQAFLEGAAGVEVDTRLTADGVAVCFHDETVDRTTNGTGPVESLTLAELKALDAGAKYDPSFAGTRVPTLAEALTAAKGKGIVYLDIKTPGQAQAFADAIAESAFPIADLWFWTPGDPGYAAEIRSLVPGAKILWGAPDPAWETTPGYFEELRTLGVIGFSIGTGTGTPDLAFATRAKQEGFLVEVYTVNDPDTMLRCAAAGVDYIETDFPATVAALQPPQLATASLPGPADQAVIASPSVVLRWVPATGATAHRVHFGTSNPPPFLVEQSSDLHQTGSLSAGSTYFWRIDEVTPGGTVTGPVWSFTTPAPATGTILEWTFSGDLSAATGQGTLNWADGAGTQDQVSFETSDGLQVPHPNGQPVDFLRIPAFTDRAHGFDLSLTGIDPNGGSATRVTRYSMIFDLLVPAGWNWVPFFNSTVANTNDSDLFVRSNGGIGINSDGLGYTADGSIQPDTWHRIVWVVDLPAGVVSIYIDGIPGKTRTGAPLPDTNRWALAAGAGPAARLFNDEDGETSPVLLSAFAFTNIALTASQIGELGGTSAGGIFPSSPSPLLPLTISRGGANLNLSWPPAQGRRLQRSTGLAGWQDVPGTSGAATHTEPIVTGTKAFFRVVE